MRLTSQTLIGSVVPVVFFPEAFSFLSVASRMNTLILNAEQRRYVVHSPKKNYTGLGLGSWLEEIKPLSSFVETAAAGTGISEAQWLHVSAVHSKHQSWSFQKHLDLQPDNALCLHRWKVWWSIPRLLRGQHPESKVPPETCMFLSRRVDGSYVLFLPVIDQNMGFTLEGSVSYDKDASSRFLNGSVADDNRYLMLHGHDISHGNAFINSRSTSRKAILITTGTEPFLLISSSMKLMKKHLLEESGSHAVPSSSTSTIPALTSTSTSVPLSPRGTGPAFADYLGWCTWDSFYTDLTADGVLGGLNSFQGTGVAPRFVILDDGWQGTTVDDKANSHQWAGRLTSFDANFKFADGYDGFPFEGDGGSRSDATSELPAGTLLGASGRNVTTRHSLSTLVGKIKQLHGIKHMLVWHTLMGYWSGVHVPDTKEDEDKGAHVDKFPNALATYLPENTFADLSATMQRMSMAKALDDEPFATEGIGLVCPSRVDAFFNDYHLALRAMGVDGVKVDAQSLIGSLRSERGGGYGLTLAYHIALKASISSNFGQHESPIIHCMAHSQATLLAILALYLDVEDSDAGGLAAASCHQRRLPVVRGSDDFWPKEAASHGPHLMANAVNALLISQIGLHDWDMFTTGMGKPSAMHACARAISGGPVYVSDRPEEHDPLILRRMAFSDGSVPRCLRNARPTAATLFADPQREAGVPLLIQNTNPCGGRVIGAFSIAGAVLENDLEMFRFLQPHELTWKSAEVQRVADQMRPSAEAGDSCASKTITSVHEMEEFASALSIDWWVRPSDVEGGLQPGEGYVAHRLSDGAVFVDSGDRDGGEGDDAGDVAVPLHLATVFDHDVISFATKRYAGASPLWVAAVGATDMYNPGGAVLFLSVTENVDAAQPMAVVDVRVRLLGAGKFLLVSNIGSVPQVIAAKPLGQEVAYRVEVLGVSSRALSAASGAFALDLVTEIVATEGAAAAAAAARGAEVSVSSDPAYCGRDHSDQGSEIILRFSSVW